MTTSVAEAAAKLLEGIAGALAITEQPLLWIALCLILGINISLDHARCEAIVVWRSALSFNNHLRELLQRHAAPVGRRACRLQSALSLPRRIGSTVPAVVLPYSAPIYAGKTAGRP
jgi:hypothetical protein